MFASLALHEVAELLGHFTIVYTAKHFCLQVHALSHFAVIITELLPAIPYSTDGHFKPELLPYLTGSHFEPGPFL